GALYRIRIRRRARAPDDAALRDRGHAPVLRRRPAFPAAVRMIVPERWLRSFCNPAIDAEALAHELTMSGIEVESCTPVAPPSAGVVVAQVLAVEKHPQADKLTVCKVDAGSGPVQVVCGAPNVRPGMKAPLAVPGARLPGIEVQVAKLRGVESAGMLLSS